MAKINSRFVHYNTIASFTKQKNGDGFDDECIVFIKEGKLIYTHGTLYQTLSADEYNKVSDLVIKKPGESLALGDATSVPSSGLVLNCLNKKTNFVGVAIAWYNNYNILPSSSIQDGTYLISKNSSGTAGAYAITASNGAFVEQSQVKCDDYTVYISYNGTVYMAFGNDWVSKGTLPYALENVVNPMYLKLLDIEEGATKNIIDSELSESSENAIQNKVVTEQINLIEDELSKKVVDTEFSETSTNPIQNKVLTTSLKTLESVVADHNKKLNDIEDGANNYTLPAASKTVMGGVKIGNGINVSNGTISVSIPTSFKPVVFDLASGKESQNFSNYMSGVSGPGYNGYACILLDGNKYIGHGSVYANEDSSAEIYVNEKTTTKQYTMSSSGSITLINVS